MKHFGDIELINGKILNFSLEVVELLPEFNELDKGKLILNDDDGEIYFNNGSGYTILRTSANASSVINLLGENWVNDDFSIDPTPINSLNGISGITSDSSLYDVIVKLNGRIDGTKNSLASLTDTSFSNLSNKNVVFFNGSSFSNTSITNLIDNNFQLSHDNLSDFTLDNNIEGDVLVYDGETFVNKKVTHRYNQPSPNTTHFIEHNLGEQLVNYAVMNLSNNKKITPVDVTYTDENNIVLVFDSAVAVEILVSSL